MSLVFVPKIPEQFRTAEPVKKVKVPRNPHTPVDRNLWSDKDLGSLVELRAAHVSYKDCGAMLARTQGACITAVVTNDLYGPIAKKRKRLIARALDYEG